MSLTFEPVALISKEINVQFERPPTLAKKPGPPQSFEWDQQKFEINEVLSQWFDFNRRGNMARNMQEAHLRTAGYRGSWGVGRFYFRVRTDGGRIFDIYYDRAPEDAADRKGHWFLWRELAEVESKNDD